MGGVVVHARMGDRDNYRPLRSSLCRVSRPEAIAAALLELHSFNTLYIADIDAIRGRGENCAAIAAIRERFPELDLWVDAGIGDEQTLGRFLTLGLGRPVIGTETMTGCGVLDHALLTGRPLLSLDYRDNAFVGPAELLDQPKRWPLEIILMTLARVGGDTGPDFNRLRQWRDRAPGHRIFAAGGVRHSEDLFTLAELGVAGVLLASALHNAALTSVDLAPYI